MTITKLMARDGPNCQLCGELLNRSVKDWLSDDYITFDHIIARTDGGKTELKNLQLAHSACNHKRGADPIIPGNQGTEWLFLDPSAARSLA